MRRKETFHLGVKDSEEEWFRLSILDIVVPPNYNIYAIIFKLDRSDETTIIETFKRAIEATLQQCRYLVGNVEKNQQGDYSIAHKPNSTVEFAVQWLNSPRDCYPSFVELERENFTCATLGNAATLGIEGMQSICHPDERPVPVGFQLNFIPGGFIFTIHIHHFVVDMTGTTSLVRQIADHCYSIQNATPAPAWDEGYMDRSRFYAPIITPEYQIDPSPKPPRHPDWLPCSWLLFHLPPSNAMKLKQLASLPDGEWISTYDAVIALLWRVIARNRAQIYKPDLTSPAVFGEPINMRSRCEPKISARYQGNVLAPGLSHKQNHPLTLAEVISEAPLSQMAAFIRAITRSVTQEALSETIAQMAPIRDKSNLNMPIDSLPPTSFTTTDWRDSRLCDNNFGIGQPMAYRCLYDTVVENMIVLYPPHKGNREKDQGIEVLLPFERHAVDLLKTDPAMTRYFEFRGVEAGAA